MGFSRIKNYTLPCGDVITACIPDTVTNDTSIVYFSGTVNGEPYEKSNFYRELEEAAFNSNKDTIVVFPHDRNMSVGTEAMSTHRYQMAAVEAKEVLEKDLNFKTNSLVSGGFSAAANTAARVTGHFLKTHPNAPRQILLLVDGDLDETSIRVPESEYQAMRDNKTIVISLAQPNYWNHQARELKMPILFVVNEEFPDKSVYDADGHYYGKHHIQQYKDFYYKGLFQSFTDFAKGKGALPAGYKYKFYDPATGTINDVTMEEAMNLMKISKYSANSLHNGLNFEFKGFPLLSSIFIKSDSSTLLNSLSNVREVITKSIIGNIFGGGGCASTTQVPSQIPSVVSKVISASQQLSNNIGKEINSIENVGVSIARNDKNLKNDVMDLLKF